ncbi:two-component sensor histidine kinase [Psychromonas marina]|uniref:Sensor protein n=1 Tax=Psychromonas marina TaxID=88364 RepID=A0ABQ6E1Q5_9GAMM|nr:heavy metal sensor histidine kinase [Psychromonas marina]GLS91179.1 two-component sensor histidine kinase [Psychromonas marina]
MILQRSLTLRLSCFFSLATMVVVSILYVFISYSVEQHFVKNNRKILLNKVKQIKTHIKGDHFDNDFPTILNYLERHVGFIVEVKHKNKSLYSSSFVTIPQDFFSDKYYKNNDLFQWVSNKQPYNGIKFVVFSEQYSEEPLTILLARNTKVDALFLKSFKSMMIDFIIIAGIVTAILSWFITKRGLQPLQILSKQAMLISVHDIDQRMPVKNLPIEIAGLSMNLNKMLKRLEYSFERLSNFSSDIAHELRTPINNLMMQTQVSLSKPRTEQEYRHILASNCEEYEHLTRMISDMLFLAKVENALILQSTELLSLDQELVKLCEFYDALAEENQITFNITGQASVQGDKFMLKRAFSNLISNALRHGFDNSVIAIAITTTKSDVVIAITNKGETIAPEHLPHLFERFYRVDKSRTHNTEEQAGLGLGLAITQSIARAHGGDLHVSSHENETVFTLNLKKA